MNIENLVMDGFPTEWVGILDVEVLILINQLNTKIDLAFTTGKSRFPLFYRAVITTIHVSFPIDVE